MADEARSQQRGQLDRAGDRPRQSLRKISPSVGEFFVRGVWALMKSGILPD
jgi:hypothetical protein